MMESDEKIIRPIIKNSIKFETIKKWIPEDYFEGKSFVVTGGCGFLGSWISSTILNLGGKVYCIDNLSTGITRNLDELKKSNSFKFIKKDIQKISIDELPTEIDGVIHFASRASPDDYRLYQIDTLESNSFGTKNMLELARKKNCPMLFASTSEIYGNPSILPTPESYYGYVNTMSERSCYNEGKRFSESLIHAYRQTYDMDLKVVRIFNTYGPGLRPDGSYGRAITRFVFQSLKNEPITIFGDGKQTRSFNFVTDTVAGIFAVLNTPEFKGVPINVGNSNEITIFELAEFVKKVTGSNSEIKFLPPVNDDPLRRCADTTKLQKIGWSPKVSLDYGLAKTIDWIKKEYVNNETVADKENLIYS